jgi:YidC/Oxa1 family membrane protein insertase
MRVHTIHLQFENRQEVSLAEIRNPNQQGSGGSGSDPKSMMLFAVMFLVIFLGLQYWKSKKAPATQPNNTPVAAQSSMQPPPASPVAGSSAAAGAVTSTTAPATNEVVSTTATQTVVENELYRITFSNRGAEVTSWIVKKWKDDDGKPLDLVNQTAAAKHGYPLSLYTYDPALRAKLSQALFVPSTTGTVNVPGELSFRYSSGGLVVNKKFVFDASYVIHATASIINNGTPVAALLAWPSGLGDQGTLASYSTSQFDTSQNGKYDSVAPKKVSSGSTINGQFDYAGISDAYFAAIFLPDAPDSSMVVGLNNSITMARDPKKPETAIRAVVKSARACSLARR